MSEPKQRGRKRIHPVGRVRHNVNIERDETFDADLLAAQKLLAGMRELPMSAISQTEVIKRAVRLLAATAISAPDNGICSCCNGTGFTAIRNGDDDIPCPECQSDADMSSVPY